MHQLAIKSTKPSDDFLPHASTLVRSRRKERLLQKYHHKFDNSRAVRRMSEVEPDPSRKRFLIRHAKSLEARNESRFKRLEDGGIYKRQGDRTHRAQNNWRLALRVSGLADPALNNANSEVTAIIRRLESSIASLLSAELEGRKDKMRAELSKHTDVHFVNQMVSQSKTLDKLQCAIATLSKRKVRNRSELVEKINETIALCERMRSLLRSSFLEDIRALSSYSKYLLNENTNFYLTAAFWTSRITRCQNILEKVQKIEE